jgi:hypothetical protein
MIFALTSGGMQICNWIDVIEEMEGGQDSATILSTYEGDP